MKYVFMLLLATCPILVSAEILLFTDDNEFRGCLDCSRYDTDSVCNRYGAYGSRYQSDSIWNRYGAGSRYDADSPWNRYGTGLKMVDRSGGFYGYLSMSSNGVREYRNVLRELYDNYNGDLNEIRDVFCD